MLNNTGNSFIYYYTIIIIRNLLLRSSVDNISLYLLTLKIKKEDDGTPKKGSAEK